jgi:hypothetical protein
MEALAGRVEAADRARDERDARFGNLCGDVQALQGHVEFLGESQKRAGARLAGGLEACASRVEALEATVAAQSGRVAQLGGALRDVSAAHDGALLSFRMEMDRCAARVLLLEASAREQRAAVAVLRARERACAWSLGAAVVGLAVPALLTACASLVA